MGALNQVKKRMNSPDLAGKFRFAQQVSKAIDLKIRNRELQVVGKQLIGDFEIFI